MDLALLVQVKQTSPAAVDQDQQNAILVSKNGPQAPILCHILHTSSEQLVCNLPPYFEVFNDVIALSLHLKYLFSHLA